ncbi:MAG: tripartite tricarboxylate transporter substrate binding protein [Burkholderiales bacterium]|nr:tripartite tricarboxylate transporter substrate binding protein [Burkholderiales bacterium]
MRQTWIRSLACLAALLVSAGANAAGPSYPDKPIRLIVPYPPGGGADLFARTIGPQLSAQLGQAIVVDNKPGANGIVGTEQVARSAPDGYTILMGNIGPNAINQAMYPALQYDCITDFAPVSLTGFTNHILAVHPKLGVNDVAGLIALAKRNPGKLTYASSGLGGSPHLAGELFALMTQTTLTHVPYKGASPGNSDLVGGQVDMTFNTLPPLLSYVRQGRIKALAVTGGQRAASLPDVPTLAQSGVNGYDVSTWYGIFAPAGTPPEVITRLNREIERALANVEVRSKLEAQGFEVQASTPEAFGAMVRTDVQKWRDVVKRANIKTN